MSELSTPAAGQLSLQMLRADVNVREFQRWAGIKRLHDNDHAMHCLLTECFGREMSPKPFRTIFPRGGSKGVLYGYGRADANALRDAAGIYACPLQSRIIPTASLNSKPMPSEWQLGKRLGFETRIRPIVRRSRGADSRPGKEWDAFQLDADQYGRGEMPRTREQVYTGWLSDQLERIGGAQLDLEHTEMVSFQRTRAVRKPHTRHSEGPEAVMRGILTITDSDTFADLLSRGIGRHRAYGYGMLLLRPA